MRVDGGVVLDGPVGEGDRVRDERVGELCELVLDAGWDLGVTVLVTRPSRSRCRSVSESSVRISGAMIGRSDPPNAAPTPPPGRDAPEVRPLFHRLRQRDDLHHSDVGSTDE